MATTAIVPSKSPYLPAVSPEAVEQALAIGDVSRMTQEVRIAFYLATCESAGLNPYTRPFDLMKAQDGKMYLYPNKVAAEQLRKIHRVSLIVTERRMDKESGLYFVTVRAQTPDGRQDEAQGVVDASGKKGEALANCFMRCETKAKRRVTLAICGLGYETSEDVGAHPVRFDYQQGTIIEDTPPVPMLTPGAQPFREHADDLFGGERNVPNFAREVPKVTTTPQDAWKDTPEHLQANPDAKTVQPISALATDSLHQYRRLYQSYKHLSPAILDSIPRQLWDCAWSEISANATRLETIAPDFPLVAHLLAVGAEVDVAMWPQAFVTAKGAFPARYAALRAEVMTQAQLLPEGEQRVAARCLVENPWTTMRDLEAFLDPESGRRQPVPDALWNVSTPKTLDGGDDDAEALEAARAAFSTD